MAHIEILRSHNRRDLFIDSLAYAYAEYTQRYVTTPLGNRRARWDICLTLLRPRHERTYHNCVQSPTAMLRALAQHIVNGRASLLFPA